MALIDLPFHDLHLKDSSWVVLDSLSRSTVLSRRYNRLKPPKRASFSVMSMLRVSPGEI